MRRLAFLGLLAAAGALLAAACRPGATSVEKAPEAALAHARACTVMVDTGEGFGSGVVFKNGQDTFVWTDAHVVAGCQKFERVVKPSGADGFTVSYRDVSVVTEDYEQERKVGESRSTASIVRFFKAEDIALLRVQKKGYGAASAKLATEAPKVGAKVWHVGSFHGPLGIGSVADGVVAAHGRMRRAFEPDEKTGFPYDQISGVAHPGSSGGGVWDYQTGELLGLVTEMLNASSSRPTPSSYLITPARRLRAFAKSAKCEFSLDANSKVPAALGDVTVDPVREADLPPREPKPAQSPLVPKGIIPIEIIPGG